MFVCLVFVFLFWDGCVENIFAWCFVVLFDLLFCLVSCCCWLCVVVLFVCYSFIDCCWLLNNINGYVVE